MRIENVLAIADMTIHFPEIGVFHIEGANTIGKSTIVKAINANKRNVSNLKYKRLLRDNAKTFVVTIHTYDGSWVKLSRGEVDYYEWNILGEEGRMDKTDGKVPKIVERYYNLFLVEEKNKPTECLNIRLNRTKLLFVDTTVGENYNMLQKATGTSLSLLAIKQGESLSKAKGKEMKLLYGYQEEAKDRLRVAEQEKEETVTRYEAVRELEQVIAKEYERHQGVEKIVQIGGEVSKLQGTITQLEKALAMQEYEEMQGLYPKQQQVAKHIEEYRALVKTRKELKALQAKQVQPTEEQEMGQLVEQVKRMEETLALLASIEHLEKDIQTLESREVPMEAITTTIRQVKQLEEALGVTEAYEDIEQAYRTIKTSVKGLDMEALTKAQKTMEQLDKHLQATREMQKAKKAMVEQEQVYTASDNEFIAFMREYNYCPIVAQTLNNQCPFEKV